MPCERALKDDDRPEDGAFCEHDKCKNLLLPTLSITYPRSGEEQTCVRASAGRIKLAMLPCSETHTFPVL